MIQKERGIFMKKKKLALILAVSLAILSVSPQQIHAAAWKKDSTGWWYQEDNGTYAKSQWKKIGSDWYWFDANGYMAVGWKKINNSWYYFKTDGAMLGKGWHKIGSSYYYMYDTGAMAQNTWIGNDYVDANGVWIQGKTKYVQGWKKSGTRWWYCHKDGSYTKNGWEKINGKYYYFDASGYMLTGWKKVSSTWYYLKSDGAMMNSGWLKIKGQWYYFREDGSMMGAGWHKIKGNYYYMNSNGAMASDTWIGDYYVDANGVWTKTVTSKQKVYKAYNQIVKNHEFTYGTAKVIKPSNGYPYMTGLCLIKLVDFDHNGTEQLLLVYSASDNCYYFEVWNCDNDQSYLLAWGPVWGVYEDSSTLVPQYGHFSLAEYGGKTYLLTGYLDTSDLSSTYYFSGYSGNTFTKVKTFSSDGNSNYKINNKTVSQSTYKSEINAWSKTCVSYDFNSQFEKIRDVNYQTKQTLSNTK